MRADTVTFDSDAEKPNGDFCYLSEAELFLFGELCLTP